MRLPFLLHTLLMGVLLVSCGPLQRQPKAGGAVVPAKGSFGYDRDFLLRHCRRCILLSDANGKAQLIASGDYQGRVMTSTARGDSGASFGWINYELVASGKQNTQFNPYGGEERFWLGPEGGQYALYFAPGDSFTIDHWKVPAVIDTDSFEVRAASSTEVVFGRQATVRNYKGTSFSIDIVRSIHLLQDSLADPWLAPEDSKQVDVVMYSSENRITNQGPVDWKREDGLLSIWLLGMMTPSPQTIVFIPFHPSPHSRSYINDSYFGKVPADRLVIEDSMLYFRCDGSHRSKIGLPPAIAKPLAASIDFERNTLNLVLFEVEKDAAYVNSKWEWQRDPFSGDVVNSYNDGPLKDGSQLGPFYEIESSSPGLSLRKGESGVYRQVTLHIQGPFERLRAIAMKYTGADIAQIRDKFAR